MAKPIEQMGHFTAIHMRKKVKEEDALVINTCSGNETAAKGDPLRWTWSNPTNTAIKHICGTDVEVSAVSVECLWQGTKIFDVYGKPDQKTLAGDWRRGKARKPVGAWNGPHRPLIRTPGEARVSIYIPAFRNLVEHWLKDEEVAFWVQQARDHKGNVYLRDHDTGRGVFRNGPMSHAWLMCTWLNTGRWPGEGD